MTQPHKPEIVLVVAYSRNRVIGRDNQLPWRLPSDLAHFKRTTLGHPILMGRRTWQSLPRVLPGRENIVITRQSHFDAPGATVVHSVAAALQRAADTGAEQACVIGGAEIFALTLPLAHRLVATEIDADIEGDTWFPELNDDWAEVDRQQQPEENGLSFSYVTYRRSTPG